MKVAAVANDIKREFIELCCNSKCGECTLTIAPSCWIWYTFRYLENNGKVRKGYIGLENDICNKYYNEVYQVSDSSKHHAYEHNEVLEFITWLNENGYLKGVEK